MFGRKKKPAAQASLTVWSESGEVLYDGRLTGLVLRDETIKRLSLHFFNDPEPCKIHRSAVLSRVFAELEAALEGGAVAGIGSPGVPEEYFAAYPNAHKVRLTAG